MNDGRSSACVLAALALAGTALISSPGCNRRGAAPPQTSTTQVRSGNVDGQTGVPAGVATAWTTEGGPASPGVPSTGDFIEEPNRADGGRR